MTNISETSRWEEDIYQVKRGDKVEGGAAGVANIQARQLAARTRWLKGQLESAQDYREYTFYKSESDPDGTITGLANTPSRKIFRVTQGLNDDLAFIYYLNDNGTAVPVASLPSATGVVNVFHSAVYASQSPALSGYHSSESNDGYLFAVADRQGRAIELLDEDYIRKFFTPVVIQGVTLSSSRGRSGIFDGENIRFAFDPQGNTTAGNTEISPSDDMLYGVVDSSGRCLSRYDARGKFRAVLHEDVIRQISQEFGVSEFKKRMLADRVHIQMCGQSLAGGIGSGRISSAATATGWLMPSGGIEDGQTLSVGLTGLPLTSSSFVGMDPTVAKNLYENPLYGVCAQLQGMLNAESAAVSVSGSASWHGEYKISQLDKEGGSPQYDVAVAQSRAYAGYSSTEAKSFLSHVMCWIQGESDITAGTSPDEYLRRLNNLIADYQSDVGQDMPPVMVTYQTGSHTRRAPYYSPDIPQVQLLAANTNPYIFMACPTYVFPYNSDGVHMPGNSYRWMGCYFGKAIYHILTENAWKPLQPESVYRNGRVVTVVMHVPVSPLVLDTDMVSNPGDYGFEVWGDTDGARKTIQSVTVSGNRVTLVLDADPGQTVVVKYAQGAQGANAGPTTGARGNLRDSDSTLAYCRDVTATDPNSPYKLYNWCPIFSLKEGFSWVQ
ncbi:sialate O-acetylesterase [Klebsiella pneumoniae]|uniref:Putative prophage endo-N-neuraminidase n=1 Tax=Klebsiella pneumoniae TaxID=573 RepID=A0A486TCH5_KLEPN|nr:putative prophage endo-N-neuraminidase [Klebsiella pneumoniae]